MDQPKQTGPRVIIHVTPRDLKESVWPQPHASDREVDEFEEDESPTPRYNRHKR